MVFRIVCAHVQLYVVKRVQLGNLDNLLMTYKINYRDPPIRGNLVIGDISS